jgi:transposase
VRKKGSYKTIPIQRVDSEALLASINGTIIVAVDIAKEAMVVGFADAAGCTRSLARFSHPNETQLFIELLLVLRGAARGVEIAMEATGVYGDALRHQMRVHGFEVFRVDAKQCHDAATLLDGVASQHDAKACTLIAHLHAQGISQRWRERSAEEVHARTLLDEHTIQSDPLDKLYGRLEAMTAAHWPELNAIIDRRTSWYLHLFADFPGPAAVTENLAAALDLLRRKTFGRAVHTGIAAVVARASVTLGVPLSREQRGLLQAVARHVLTLRIQIESVEMRMRALCDSNQAMARMAEVVGPAAATAIFGDLGSPSRYGSAAALEKAAGLNLREKSSGKHHGRLHLTKRGPGRVRHYLYLAATRMIIESPVVRGWFQNRNSFVTGIKRKAIVAIMRKLIRAMFYVARGEPFDPCKLFDVRKLALPTDWAHRSREDVTVLAPVNVASSPCSPVSVARALPRTRLRVSPDAQLPSAGRGDAASARAMGGRMPPAGAPSSRCASSSEPFVT